MRFALRVLINTVLMVPVVALFLTAIAFMFASATTRFWPLYGGMVVGIASTPAMWLPLAAPALLATVIQLAVARRRARRNDRAVARRA